MKTKNAKRSRRTSFLAVCAVLLAVLWGGGLFLGCENTAGGGSSSRSSSGSSSGGSTTPLQAPSTADMIDDLFDSSKGGLTDPNDKKNIEDFLNALSGPAREALNRNGWTNNTGADAGKATALKDLADEYASKKGAADDPVKLLNDLASNNKGNDNSNKSSDLDAFLKDTANKSGGQIDTSGTLSDLQNAKGKQDEVLKALGNGNENNGKGKSEQLNALNPAVTSADLAPIVSGITNQDNKNKLADVANDLIADLVKDTTKHPTGTNDLKTYLDDNSNTAADLNKYKEEIKNSYPITSGQTIKQFIDSLADIYKKLGNGDEAAGKAIYNKLIAGGVTAAQIKDLVTPLDQTNAAKIKDITPSVVADILNKTNAPQGSATLAEYLKDSTTDIKDLEKYADGIKNIYKTSNGKSLIDYIKEQNQGATGNRPPLNVQNGNSSGDPEAGDAITEKGIVKKGTEIKAEDGKLLGYVYKVDTVNKIAYAVGDPSSSSVTWGNGSNRSTTDEWEKLTEANTPTGLSGWQNILSENSSALYANFPAIKYATCYKRDNWNSLDQDSVKAIYDDTTSYSSRWYLPTASEYKDIYDGLSSLPADQQTKIKGKIYWTTNTYGTYKSITFDMNSGTKVLPTSNNRTSSHYALPIAQFKY